MTHCQTVSGNGCAKVGGGANSFLCFRFAQVLAKQNRAPVVAQSVCAVRGKRRMTAWRTKCEFAAVAPMTAIRFPCKLLGKIMLKNVKLPLCSLQESTLRC